jgi:hypothetical protein
MIAFKEKKASWSKNMNMRNRLNEANGADKSTAMIPQDAQLLDAETTPHLSELVQLSQQTQSSTPTKTNQKNKLLESKEKSVSLMITALCLIFLIAHLPETFLKLIRKLFSCFTGLTRKKKHEEEMEMKAKDASKDEVDAVLTSERAKNLWNSAASKLQTQVTFFTLKKLNLFIKRL